LIEITFPTRIFLPVHEAVSALISINAKRDARLIMRISGGDAAVRELHEATCTKFK
jgi:hypothetical protein